MVGSLALSCHPKHKITIISRIAFLGESILVIFLLVFKPLVVSCCSLPNLKNGLDYALAANSKDPKQPWFRNYRGPRFGNQMLELIVVRESLLPEKFSYTNVKTNCCRRTCQSRYADVETNCCQRTSDMPVLKPIVRDSPIPIPRC